MLLFLAKKLFYLELYTPAPPPSCASPGTYQKQNSTIIIINIINLSSFVDYERYIKDIYTSCWAVSACNPTKPERISKPTIKTIQKTVMLKHPFFSVFFPSSIIYYKKVVSSCFWFEEVKEKIKKRSDSLYKLRILFDGSETGTPFYENNGLI